MLSRALLAFLGIAPFAMLAALVFGGAVAEAGFAVLAAILPVALMALGARSGAALDSVRGALLALLLLLGGGMLAMLALRGQVVGAPWVAGLPLAAAIQLYGIGLLPLPIACLAYALGFERHGLRAEQLAELERRFGRHRAPEQ